jgi:CBS domain-containing protein
VSVTDQAAHAVADAMVTQPAVLPASATVGAVRALFADEHVHMALLVDGSELVGALERADLDTEPGDRAPAAELAALAGRTIRPDVPLPEALETMARTGCRRLAVTTDDAKLLGLLCLKADGSGFCSDRDVDARRRDPRPR